MNPGETRTREEALTGFLQLEMKGLPALVDCIVHRRPQMRPGYALRELAAVSATRGCHAFFVEGDLAGMKQHFHVASRLTLAGLGEAGDASFSLVNALFLALLSDDAAVIDALAGWNAPTPSPAPSMVPSAATTLLQLAIRGDDAALQERIETMPAPPRADHPGGPDFYALLLRRDASALARLIGDRHAAIRSDDVRWARFMAHEAVLEAKLCWRRGIDVQIEHPMVPMALMPVEPLAQYDPTYDFLRPGWVPPPQGLPAALGRWLRRRR